MNPLSLVTMLPTATTFVLFFLSFYTKIDSRHENRFQCSPYFHTFSFIIGCFCLRIGWQMDNDCYISFSDYITDF